MENGVAWCDEIWRKDNAPACQITADLIPSFPFVLSGWRVLRKRTKKHNKPQKAVYLRFERISQKRRERVLWMSDFFCTFAALYMRALAFDN